MRTLFVGLRVTDLEVSLGFYTVLGYRVLGRIVLYHGGSLVALSLSDEPVATLELVHRPARAGRTRSRSR